MYLKVILLRIKYAEEKRRVNMRACNKHFVRYFESIETSKGKDNINTSSLCARHSSGKFQNKKKLEVKRVKINCKRHLKLKFPC